MKLLDLFCGAGGCSVGYHRAGFECVGVDLHPQKHYPFEFIQGDALEFVSQYGRDFDAIHASPPCQAYTCSRHLQGNTDHPQLVEATRLWLNQSGKLWVMENVPGAPMRNARVCCGLTMGVLVKRHRLFEANFPLEFPPCPEGHPGKWFTVFGGGAARLKWDGRRRATAQEAKDAMGINWMNRNELSQAIPPAYTEFIGKQLMAQIERESHG